MNQSKPLKSNGPNRQNSIGLPWFLPTSHLLIKHLRFNQILVYQDLVGIEKFLIGEGPNVFFF